MSQPKSRLALSLPRPGATDAEVMDALRRYAEIGERLACAIARTRGGDPDAPSWDPMVAGAFGSIQYRIAEAALLYGDPDAA